MAKLFGTDGVRGVANDTLTPELTYRLGRAGAYFLAQGKENPKIVIGKDTRISGDMLEAALIAGVCSVGVDACRLGIIPTPGVSYLTRQLGAAAGVVISASHNPFGDNGIKFFGANGFKLSDEVEEQIEKMVLSDLDQLPRPVGAKIGRVKDFPRGPEEYINYAKSLFRGSLKNIKIVVDCSNGASSEITPRVLAELGANIIPIFAGPDGTNINDGCGSTHPELLMQAVLENQAHLGLAHDGDADRVLAVDEKGDLVDGDQVMVICALALMEQNALANNTMVVTVMSNLGLHNAMKEAGIKTLQTKVGDRYVLEEMQKSGAVLGGEQSGHIIFLNQNTTGDGLITALNLLQVIVDTQKPLSELASQMNRLPQVMVNVRVQEKQRALSSPQLARAITKAENQLGERGRILIRPSGTEPLIRVMAEGPMLEELKTIVADLAETIKND